jgi:hypothetical protein
MSFLGYTHPSVSATNQLYNIVAIPSGVYRYWQEKRLVRPLAWAVILGTLPGVFAGALIRVLWLPDPRAFRLFAALVLLYIGLRMGRDLLRGTPRRPGDGTAASARPVVASPPAQMHATRPNQQPGLFPIAVVVPGNAGRIVFEFDGVRYDAPLLGIAALSLIVGIVGGIYGIGGGAIIAPFFVSFFRLPVYTVAGAALMGTLVTSLAGVVFYHSIAPFFPSMSIAPDWLLGLLFGIGGMAGMYLGARCQKHVPAAAIKLLLSAVLLLTAGRYIMASIGH